MRGWWGNPWSRKGRCRERRGSCGRVPPFAPSARGRKPMTSRKGAWADDLAERETGYGLRLARGLLLSPAGGRAGGATTPGRPPCPPPPPPGALPPAPPPPPGREHNTPPPAVPGRDVGFADAAEQDLPDAAQRIIAHLVPVLVVVPLERIHVQEDQGEGLPVTGGAGDLAGEGFLEIPVVVQAGQPVGDGPVPEGLAEPRPFLLLPGARPQ